MGTSWGMGHYSSSTVTLSLCSLPTTQFYSSVTLCDIPTQHSPVSIGGTVPDIPSPTPHQGFFFISLLSVSIFVQPGTNPLSYKD